MTHPDRPRSPQLLRLWTAVAVLPLITAALAFMAFPLVWAISGNQGRPFDSNEAAGAFAFVAGFFGSVVTFGGAAPLAFWRLRRGSIPLRQSVVDGLLLGNVPFLLYVVAFVLPLTVMHMVNGTMSGRWLPVTELVLGALRAIVIGSLLGMASGAIFWAIGLRETDDRPLSLLR